MSCPRDVLVCGLAGKFDNSVTLTIIRIIDILRIIHKISIWKHPVRRVSSTEFQKKIGLYQDIALTEPLAVTSNGREKIVVLSAGEYRRLKRRDREVLRVEDLTAEDLEAIAAAKPPAKAASFDHEVE